MTTVHLVRMLVDTIYWQDGKYDRSDCTVVQAVNKSSLRSDDTPRHVSATALPSLLTFITPYVTSSISLDFKLCTVGGRVAFTDVGFLQRFIMCATMNMFLESF